jgi:hypothetical protein
VLAAPFWAAEVVPASLEHWRGGATDGLASARKRAHSQISALDSSGGGLRQQPLVGEQRRLRAADISAVRESAISAAYIFTPQAAYT